MQFFTIILTTLLISVGSLYSQQKELDPKHPVQAQLEAYNNRNIENFLEQYSDTIKVFSFPNKLLYTGKERMRKSYTSFFEKSPELHCKLINRIIQDNIIIDHEDVTIKKDRAHINAIAIYKIKDEKIIEVTFIQ